MSRYQQDLERGFIMTAAYDHACERRPLAMAAARERMVDELEKWANSETWMDEKERELREAMRRHPAGKARSRECTPPEWQPDPDFTAQFYARSTRSLLADVFWAVVEIFAPKCKAAKR
ncbi:hypothetical protein [Tsukamurella sp. USMM236]|uniref:hypothetical protein n=1 Tax=Tsukamurella sp. USMM236 TaxID=3081301 RepID=UPI003016AB96